MLRASTVLVATLLARAERSSIGRPEPHFPELGSSLIPPFLVAGGGTR
jgi:hypothetical protein